jgi:hypothetical protein
MCSVNAQDAVVFAQPLAANPRICTVTYAKRRYGGSQLTECCAQHQKDKQEHVLRLQGSSEALVSSKRCLGTGDIAHG